MNPTLYDILGVSPDASRDEIRKAWREAADRFEPGEGGSTKQFRLFNEAAEVLLDPERRKEYDAQLGRPEPAPSVPGPPMPGAARAVRRPVPAAEAEAAAGKTEGAETAKADDGKAEAPAVNLGKSGKTGEPAKGEPGKKEEPAKTEAAKTEQPGMVEDEKPAAAVAVVGGDPGTPAESPLMTATSGRSLGWPLLGALGVLTAIAVGVAAYFVIQAEQTDDYQEALDRAPAAAESAATAVLSYDWESLEADRDAAAKFLTDDYREDYVETFDKLVTESATQTKATVEAEVLASSAMLGTPGEYCEGDEECAEAAGERDADRIPVLLFVNQTTTSSANTGQPSVALNRVRFDMVNVDGTWLVDGITSY